MSKLTDAHRRILRVLRLHPAISAQEVTTRTGHPQPVVHRLLKELKERESPMVAQADARYMLAKPPADAVLLAGEFSALRRKVCAFNYDFSLREATAGGEPVIRMWGVDPGSMVAEEEIDEFAVNVESLLGEIGSPHVAALGITAPGWVDETAGEVRRIPHLGPGVDANVKLVAGLRRRFRAMKLGDIPTQVHYDPKAIWFGERLWGGEGELDGRGERTEPFVVVTMGLGLGAAALPDDAGSALLTTGAEQLRRPISMAATALHPGHVHYRDPFSSRKNKEAIEVACRCGTPGCYCAWVSNASLRERIEQDLRNGDLPRALEKALRDANGGIDTAQVGRWLNDPRSKPRLQQHFDEMGEALGTYLAMLQHIWLRQTIVLNGGLSNSWPAMESAARKAFEKKRSTWVTTTIEKSSLDHLAALYGAAELISDTYFERLYSNLV